MNKCISTYFLLVICNCACFSSANAQELKFSHYSIEEGLSESVIHSILQDDNGFLWFGTIAGLNKFDGIKFYQYYHIEDDSTSLSDSFINVLFQDSSGKIWIGTRNGLNILNAESGKEFSSHVQFIRFSNDSSYNKSISNNNIKAIYESQNGDLWIGTLNGLNKISYRQRSISKINDYKFKHYLNNENKNSISHNSISSLIQDKNENLWIGTLGGGLNKLSLRTDSVTQYLSNEFSANSVSSNYIMSLFSSDNNCLWIGTYNGGLVKFDIGMEKFTTYKNIPNENSLSDNRVFSIDADKSGSLWIGTFGGGINKLDYSAELFEIHKSDKRKNFTIKNDFIREVLIDNTNNLWAGTNEGLEKLKLNPPKFKHFKNDPWNTNSLQNDNVLSFIEDSNGIIWIGTNEGLDNFNSETNEFKHFEIDHNSPKSGKGFVYSVLEDQENNIWIGTFGGGLYKLNPTNNSLMQYLNSKSKVNSILDNRVITVKEDEVGNLLIGTAIGACSFNKRDELFYNFLVSSKDSVCLTGKRINSLLIDNEKFTWVGTSEGLFRINIEGICTKYSYYENDRTSISEASINSIYEDADNNLWISTSKGLGLYKRSENNFIRFSVDDGLPSNAVAGVVQDNDGNLWVTTQKGAAKINFENNKIISAQLFDAGDGIQGLEFNDRAIFKSSKGQIYLGGRNGFNIHDPSEVRKNEIPPNVVLTSFKKYDKQIYNIDQISNLDELNLTYSDQFFSFEFAALDFTDPLKNQYAYLLEGFDSDWNFIGSRNNASYTNIDPGNYVFRVKASNNDNVWNNTGASIKIIINPPLWKTWYAYLTYGILFISILLFIRSAELKKGRRKEEQLILREREEAKLKEIKLRAEAAEYKTKIIETEKELEKLQLRKRIATDLHDEIGSNLSSIMLLTSLVSKNIDPVNSNSKYLNDIYNAAKTSAESIRDIVWFINPASDEVKNLISRMNETANTMLSGINFSFNHPKLNKSNKLNPELRRNLYLSFKEILNNIIKHSRAENVVINIKEENNSITISIADDGIGFDESKIFLGNGLKNLRERINRVNGSIKIASNLDIGTSVKIEVSIT